MFLVLAALLSVEVPAADLLAAGEKSLAELEYDAAAESLMRAATAPDATPELRVRAHLLAGIANRIAGHDVDAQLNFRYVLRAAPDTHLPEGTSPKVLSFFETIRQEMLVDAPARPPMTTSTAPVTTSTAPVTTSSTPPSTSSAAASTSSAPSMTERLASGQAVIDDDKQALALAPWAVTAGGAVVALGGALGIAFAESALANPGAPGSEREGMRALGMASTGALALGVVVGAAGAWWATSP